MSKLGPEVENSQDVVEERPEIDIPAFMQGFRDAVDFHEFDADLVVTKDPLGFERLLPDGSTELYLEKMQKEREVGGRNEAMSWGLGKIDDTEAVVLISNWEFMQGTGGVVVGEKIVRAAQYATENNLPIIIALASGGQRQQEGAAAVREMKRAVFALGQFKEKTSQPLVVGLIGQVWGGMTASVVPMADEVIGLSGTRFGFAGPKLIKEFQKDVELTPYAQTVENSALTNRKVHVIVNDQAQLLDYLDKRFKFAALANRPPRRLRRLDEVNGLDFDRKHGYRGFFAPTRPDVPLTEHLRREMKRFFKIKPHSEPIWQQYQTLITDPRRPDPVYILYNAFDDFIPLSWARKREEKDGTHFEFQPIFSALGVIEYRDESKRRKRLFRMVIGNQPSYIKLRDGSVIIDQENSNPTAWDYQSQLAAMRYGARLKYQLTSFVNVLGARPTEQDEDDAQFDGIGWCLDTERTYPYFTSGYLIGVGGSGGGLATYMTADYAVMLGGKQEVLPGIEEGIEGEVVEEGGAQEYVAVPTSAAKIVYKDPKVEDVIRTAKGMRPNAWFLESRKLVDRVITEPEGGAQSDPPALARLIRNDIIRVEQEYGHLTPDEIKQRRMPRVLDSHPIEMGHLSGEPFDRHRPFLGRLRHH